MKAERLWSNTNKILRENDFQPRILFPDVLSVPDMQDSKTDLFCTFSPEARGMCMVPKRERERERERGKLRMKDIEFSKRGGWKKSLRAWVIGDGKHQGLEDNQFRLKQEKEGSGEKQN